ncbi:hypothetical protein ruthe_01653 [Rubellimicrobium thermophilum DSM 16684]|uniref:DUF2852 domain-containing protein n=1 Tax=Rubellimicrobium thermophilum DSM 16684 TaxID=1123069 RepID=S9R208_9RHOB|nr:DUF2852 domain-containing protein [Rubellimicrobium thermophilum]EPX85932.1 hypothetical protein ruthe_01653 [Rubellimicrobium thermophilum DSM 16684]
MTTADLHAPAEYRRDFAGPVWFLRIVDWLDERGKWAWLAAMVAGFVLFWPIGLAILAYMIWSKRMFSSRHALAPDGSRGLRCGRRHARSEAWAHARTALRPSGNAAFDAYKAETLRRLEEEQRAFEEFLSRLREARDKAEFDQFMEERARRAREARDIRPADEGSQDA